MLLMKQNMKNSMLSITRVKSEFGSPDEPKVFCPACGRGYKLKSSLRNHMKWECGKEPQFKCPYCTYKAKQKMHITRHIERMHKVIDYSAVKKEEPAEAVNSNATN
uniref:Longitudinals lacking protein-like n=1 Tax=Diabrotica virgifera virgifera TaxID=50390 RepID=A0A6P7FVW8_DIAVI